MPELVGPQRTRTNADQMFHCDRAPESELRKFPLRDGQARHCNRVGVVEVVAQKGAGARVVLVGKHHPRAIEFHVIDQPAAHPRQMSDGLDVVIATPRQEPYPPASRILAEYENPAGFNDIGAMVMQDARLSSYCNAAMSEPCHYFDKHVHRAQSRKILHHVLFGLTLTADPHLIYSLLH